jgi:endonuclease/exonuclease/phosphatase family metal-dependent hydrolase
MSNAEPRQITVMTWNLWGRALDWRARARNIRATLDKHRPDILSVQEAWSTPDGKDQVAELATHIGYHHVACHDAAVPDRGLGILARWPIHAAATLSLPDGGAPAEHRAALAVDIAMPTGSLTVYCTHLNWRLDHGPIRRLQLATIADDIANRPQGGLPVVVCGDLNADADADEIRMMTGLGTPAVPGLVFQDAWTAAGNTEPGHTWTHRNPYARAERLGNGRLDYILVQWRSTARSPVIATRLIDGEHTDGIWPSDHAAVLSTLELP